MKKRSRIISLLLATVMVFSVPAQAIYAAESTTMQETVNAEESENEASEVVQNSENAENTEEVQSTEDVQGTQPVMESESAGEETQNLLNYLVVDKPYIEQGDIQSIVASVGDENTVVESATLAYHRESDGKKYQADVSEYKDHAMLFKISFEESAETGVYILDSLTYTVDGEVHTVELAKIGIEAKYGVNTEVESTADAEVVDSETEDSTTADIDVVTFDAEGNQTSANSIEEAITEQKEELNSGKARISTRSRAGNVVVVLDPGHDSTHAGAQGLNGLHEETLNFKIAQYCKEELQQYSGVTVYMTRNSVACPYPGTSSGEDNAKRVAYAQSVGANVYVSIHLNSAGASANGAMVFYPNQSYRSDIGSQGQNLASQVLTQLKVLGLKDNGVKIRDSESGDTYSDGSLADYYGVIRGSKKAGFPGIIIEHAFVTNASDAAFLSSEANLKKLGQADAAGIANYFGLVKGEWVQDKNGWWFRYSNGTWPANEWVFIGGYWYYFNNNGYRETGWLNLNGVKYYLNENGQMITGWKQFDNTWYYFDQSGVMQTGWVTVGGTWYYLEPDGKMVTGWKTVGNASYYFNSSGAMCTGNATIDGKLYRFSASGAVIEGWIYQNNIWYWLNVDGTYATGFKTIGNAVYYFNEKEQMVTGWQNISNTWYWFNNSGFMRTGWLLLGNTWYYFESDGKMVTGWKTVNGSRYYFEVSGAMVTGYHVIDGKSYDFGTDGRCQTVLQDGWNSEGDTWYYVSGGQLVKGWKQIGSTWYYMDKDTGKMQTDWVKVGNYWYWFNGSGAMLTGYQQLNGTWYYMNKKENDKGPEGALTYTGVTSIMGTSMIGTDKATVVQKMVNQYVKSNAIYPSEALAVGGAPDIVTFCGILYDEAVAENIKPEIMYAQAMLETGYLKYGGIVQVWQFNFGGLGAVDGNASGGCATFPDVRTGLRAQVQHLKAYASKETLNNNCVDPRFNMVTRGTAPYVEWLGQKENPNVNSKGDSYGWASGESYGFNIMSMINRMN